MSSEIADPGPFWASVRGPQLAQGDYLPRCPVPLFPADYGGAEGYFSVGIESSESIVLTQTCDLANGKAQLVALCQFYAVSKVVASGGKLFTTDRLEEIRKGRVEGLHMIAAPDELGVRVADFRDIYSLPVAFLAGHADSLGPRWRLKSPYLEHFSQAFARFFMRVGLPVAIPPFKSSPAQMPTPPPA